MNRLWAIALLTWRFVRSLALSAWATGAIILTHPEAPNRGLVRLDYGDLPDSGAMLLGTLVTLTPGTSLVDLDTDERVLLLHLLDTSEVEITLTAIRREFLEPIRMLYGHRP